MNIIKHNFTNKEQSKTILKELNQLNFIFFKCKKKTLYTPNIKKIQDAICKFKNEKLIKKILNISPINYLRTAVLYKVSFDFFV